MSKWWSCWLAAAMAAASAQAAPLADAWERPAMQVREPAKAVLLGASRAGGKVVAVGERGIVVVSDDGGRSWQQARVPVAVTLTAVRHVDERTAYAVGHAGTVLVTHDGGASWTRRLDGRRAAQIALEAARASGDPQALRSAELLVQDGPDKPFFDLHFFDARRGVVIGAYGLIFATEDGGDTWTSWLQRLPNPRALHLHALRVRGDTWFIAGEQGLVLRSTDGGRSFSAIQTPYRGSYFTLELLPPHQVVVAGLRGNVWRSTDDGATWSQVALPGGSSVTASARSRDGGLWFGTQAGTAFRWNEGPVVPSGGGALPPLYALLPLDGSDLLALGPQGVLRVSLGVKP